MCGWLAGGELGQLRRWHSGCSSLWLAEESQRQQGRPGQLGEGMQKPQQSLVGQERSHEGGRGAFLARRNGTATSVAPGWPGEELRRQQRGLAGKEKSHRGGRGACEVFQKLRLGSGAPERAAEAAKRLGGHPAATACIQRLLGVQQRGQGGGAWAGRLARLGLVSCCPARRWGETSSWYRFSSLPMGDPESCAAPAACEIQILTGKSLKLQ